MKFIFLLISIIIVFSCNAFAQFDLSLGPDWNFTGVGARAAGMGGAFIGVADDATAVIWNPGGLTQLYRPEASIVTILLPPLSVKVIPGPPLNLTVSTVPTELVKFKPTTLPTC